MRYFIVIILLAAGLLVSMAGLRGGFSRRTPLEVFPDMKRQPRVRPQKPSGFFADRLGSRLPVVGTVPSEDAIENKAIISGRTVGTTNWVEMNPLPVTSELLARGRERFAIYCLPCHSATGDGNGIVPKYSLVRAGNFHDARLVRMADGEIFNTITMGKNLMASYAYQVPAEDRWAVVAYVRVLQRSRLGSWDDVPAADRAGLKP